MVKHVSLRNCNHIKEPNCNVKHQLEIGNIAQFRYDHYLQLFNEISNRKVQILNDKTISIIIIC